MDKQKTAPEVAAHDNDFKTVTTQNYILQCNVIYYYSDQNIILNLFSVQSETLSIIPMTGNCPHLAPGVRGGVIAHDLFAEIVFSNRICSERSRTFYALVMAGQTQAQAPL